MDAQLRLIPRSQASTRAEAPATRRRLRSTTSGAASTTLSATTAEREEAPINWRIDDSARERGRVGISRAREALVQARRPLADHGHTTAA